MPDPTFTAAAVRQEIADAPDPLRQQIDDLGIEIEVGFGIDAPFQAPPPWPRHTVQIHASWKARDGEVYECSNYVGEIGAVDAVLEEAVANAERTRDDAS